jgi:hypothetical protein
VTLPEIAGIIALALSIAANIPYIVETIQGKVKPERISWFIWTLLGIIYFWTAILEQGAVMFTAGELLGPVVAFLLALKYGVGGKSRFDTIMLILALMAIGWLLFTENALVGLILALIADGIASVLTIRKLHIDPSSESRWAWGLFAVSAIFALTSLTNWTLETVLFPAYVLVVSAYITIKAHPSKNHRDAELDKL